MNISFRVRERNDAIVGILLFIVKSEPFILNQYQSDLTGNFMSKN